MTPATRMLGVTSLLCVIASASLALTQDSPDTKPRSRSVPQPVDSFEEAPTYAPGPGVNKPTPVFNTPRTYGPPPTVDADDFNSPRPIEPNGLFYQPGASGPVMRYKTYTRQVLETVAIPMTADEIKHLQEFRSAKQKLKDAKDDAARKAATDVIQKQLAKAMEEDLTQKETELAAVEERVKLLRKQLERRKAAKDEIISLRLKTIVNSAEGLGFPGDEDTTDGPNIPGPGPSNQPLGPANGLPTY